MLTYNHLAEQYLEALDQGDLPGILELFEPGAMVFSPLYGQVEASAFYPKLMAVTVQSRTKLLSVIKDIEEEKLALYFHYTWTLANGEKVEFDCVDLMKISPEMRINELRILYDTYPIRPYIK